MKPQFVIGLLGMVLVPCSGLSEALLDNKPVEKENSVNEWRLLKKPLPKAAPEKRLGANSDKPLADKARQVFEVFQVIGAAAKELAGAVDDQPDPLEQQFAPQFRLVLQTELHFVRVICQPTPEQYQTIKAAGDTGLKNTLKKFVALQNQLQQGMRRGQLTVPPDPRVLISEALASSVRRTLSPEQARRYQEELVKRAAARKRAALLCLVARLDKDLVLTAEQRNQLIESLNANWQDAWGGQLEAFLYSQRFGPVLPDNRLLPILTARQQEVWRGLPKNPNIFLGWLGFRFLQVVEMADEAEMDAASDNVGEKKQAKPADEKKKGQP